MPTSLVFLLKINKTYTITGPRACYDEGKRVSETLSYAYMHQENVTVRVARIFNTYGPRMHMNDGRVVSNFILQCLKNETITVWFFIVYFESWNSFEECVADIRAWESNQVFPVRVGSRRRAGCAHGFEHEQASQPGKSYRKDHQRCADQEKTKWGWFY